MIRKMLAVAAVVVCGMGVPALAQEGYVGASYLSTSAEFDSSGGSFNPSAESWKIFGGYNVNKYFGIEATYYDMGDLEDTSGGTTLDASIEVFDVSFRGILPLGEVLQLTGKIGGSNVDVEASTTGTLFVVSGDGSSWELLYGVGVEAKLGKRVGLRADWEKWDIEGSLDAWSIGGFIRF